MLIVVKEFATDTAISGRLNGQSTKLRELEPFECDGPLVGGLEDAGRQVRIIFGSKIILVITNYAFVYS
jgi:hypothetical protein